MSKKKLTKKIWYSSDIDNTGQPIIPPLAKNSDDLDGLHEGELFLHNSDEQPNIWIRTIGGRIVPLFKSGGGTADSISWINITDKPAWLVDGIIDYSEVVGTPDLSIYAKKSYVDSTFVTLSGNEDVSGIKNFTNGIKLSGIELKYDSANNAVCLQKTDGTPINFYVTGGLSMYGQGNTSVRSIMDAIAANLDSNTLAIQNGLLTVVGGTGGVDESAVRTLIESYGYTTEDWVRDYVLENASGGIESITKQMVIEALGFTPYSAENPNGYITAASIPSALKNPYALTFGSKTYDGSSAKSITASDLGAALSSDLSKYLPLTGGTVNGIINLNHTASKNSRISFKNNRTEESSWADNIINATDASGNVIMRFGIYGKANVLDYVFLGHNTYTKDNLRIYTDKVTFGSNTIWHAGNDGSGSGLDADLLDGKHNGELTSLYTKYQAATTDDLATYGATYGNKGFSVVENRSGVAIGHIGSTDTVINFGSDLYRFGRFLFTRANNSGLLYFQTPKSDVSDWGTKRQIAFIDSNVASATKLQTAIKIWGQSFDGSDNIDGKFTIANNSTINSLDKDGTARSMMFLSTSNNLNVGYGTAGAGLNTYLYGNSVYIGYGTTRIIGLTLTDTGNVGVSITPEYRFHVEQKKDNTWASVYQTPKSKVYLAHSSGRGMYASVLSGVSTSYLLSLKYNQTTLGSGGSSAFYVRTDGYIGAGTESPSAKLHVVGNILVTGGTTMYSQRSLKDIVDERGLSLTELSAIKPTRYTWKDKRDDRIHFGGIADDIEKVLPEVIYTASDGTLTMDYGNAGFAIASSLIKPVIDHETKIRMLEIRVKELEEELKRYSA